MNLLRALGDLAGRAGLASQAGLTFGGGRDLFSALGYKRTLLIRDYRERYRRNGIAARVVEMLPDATWRDGAEVFEDEDPNVMTDFEEGVESIVKRLNLWSVFHRADILAALGRYSGVVLGVPGDMKDEITSLNLEDLKFLTPYGEDDLQVDTFDEDPASDRFGQPATYQLSRVIGSRRGNKVRVHWTRVIHVVTNQLDDKVYGIPVLERVWNLLDDLEKVAGSGAEAFWLRVHQGYYFKLDPEKEIDPAEAEKIKESVDELVHGMRRTIASNGADLQVLGSDVSNFNAQVDAIITLIAGSTEIPKRILVGSERGELASSQDKTTFDERVMDRRTEVVEPNVVRQFFDRLILLGGLAEPEEYHVHWPDASALDGRAQIEIASKAAPLISVGVLTANEVRDKYLGLEPLEVEEIEVEDEVPPPQDGDAPPSEGEDEDGAEPPPPPRTASRVPKASPGPRARVFQPSTRRRTPRYERSRG